MAIGLWVVYDSYLMLVGLLDVRSSTVILRMCMTFHMLFPLQDIYTFSFSLQTKWWWDVVGQKVHADLVVRTGYDTFCITLKNRSYFAYVCVDCEKSLSVFKECTDTYKALDLFVSSVTSSVLWHILCALELITVYFILFVVTLCSMFVLLIISISWLLGKEG